MLKNMRTSNFDFLSEVDEKLSNLGRLSETFFHDDPSTTIIKLRQFAERLAQRHAANAGLRVFPDTTQAELLRELKFERAASEQVLDVFHHLRKLGNMAVHEGYGTHSQALHCMKLAVQLGVWHVRVLKGNARWKAPPFFPPTAPNSASQEVLAELERLRAERNEALSAAERAQADLETEKLKSEGAAQRELRQREERRVWEELAQEAEAERERFRQELERLEEEAQLRSGAAAQ